MGTGIENLGTQIDNVSPGQGDAAAAAAREAWDEPGMKPDPDATRQLNNQLQQSGLIPNLEITGDNTVHDATFGVEPDATATIDGNTIKHDVMTEISEDGTSGVSMDAQGNTTTFTVDENGVVHVTSSGPGKEDQNFDYTNMKNPRLDSDGNLVMDRNDGVPGTVTIKPNGEEITRHVVGHTPGANGDQYVAIKRDGPGGRVTGIETNVPAWEELERNGLPFFDPSNEDLRVDQDGNLRYNNITVYQNGTMTGTDADGNVSWVETPGGTKYQRNDLSSDWYLVEGTGAESAGDIQVGSDGQVTIDGTPVVK